MAAGLLERLDGPVTFIAGKGGVGKTTVAGALALSIADSGTATHLLSTDPAHSLGDLFEVEIGPAPRPSGCTDRLVLEELDAARLVESRLGALTPGLRELIDRGTYLDLEDADSLLDASLPGLDEIGGALRIVELRSRLVVDTAPTGHLLRLLQASATVRSWLEVFDAMAAKASAVASALVGQPMSLSVEAELETLAHEMAAFDEVVASADFVVVTGPGAVVEAETRRLVDTLRRRGLRVAATVGIPRGGAGPESVEADILLPYRRGLSGCAALRSWWNDDLPARSPDAIAASVVSPPGPRSGSALPTELDRELLVFAGKGGVGKTTCAVAMAVRLAAERRPVLLMGADPAGSLRDVLAGGRVAGLEVRELDGESELDRLRSLYREEVERAFASIGLDRAARLDRAVIESLWRLAPPGVDELMSVSRLAEEAEAGTRIVLDPAPTGHFLRLVAMPELALDWVRRIMQILLKYSGVADLEDLSHRLLRFGRRFRLLRERLMDGARTAIVVVTLDEPLARAETDRLAARLRSMELPVTGLLVNRATGPVTPRPGVVTWRAPEVDEPRGVPALQGFTRAWERVT